MTSQALPMGVLPAYHAAKGAERSAITIEGETIGYAELDARANRRARVFADRGVRQDDIVAIVLPNGLEFFETTFAVWKIGATPFPVAAQTPLPELQRILQVAQPALVVGVSGDRFAGAPAVPPGMVPNPMLSCEPLPPAVARFWKAIGSGGSTGQPKIIVSRDPSVWDPTAAPLRMQPDQVFLNPGPIHHNAAFLLTHTALFIGSHVIDMRKFDAETALRLIEQHAVNWVNFVPTMMHRIWRLPAVVRATVELSSLDTVFHMASPCPEWLKRAWIDWLGADRIWELYGSTEAVGGSIISGSEWLQRPGSVGKIDRASVRILDQNGAPCPTGQLGEVYFRPAHGANSTFFYLGAEAPALGDWQSVGDLGYADAEGYLFLLGRRGDLIISGGVNVYPAEIEALLEEHPAVRSSAVIGLPDPDLGERVHAIVEIASTSVDSDTLTSYLSSRLVRYKIPRSFEFVQTPLRNDIGKLSRAKLRAQRLAPEAGGL